MSEGVNISVSFCDEFLCSPSLFHLDLNASCSLAQAAKDESHL